MVIYRLVEECLELLESHCQQLEKQEYQISLICSLIVVQQPRNTKGCTYIRASEKPSSSSYMYTLEESVQTGYCVQGGGDIAKIVSGFSKREVVPHRDPTRA